MATQSTKAQQEHLHPSLSVVDFWYWSELELDHSRVVEFHSELVLMTKRMTCRLNCLICHLSGLRLLVMRVVQVSGASCVSHDAVRSVPSPKALLESRATVKFLNISSAPAFGLLSLSHRTLLCPNNVLGVLSMTYQPDPFVYAVSLYGVSFLMTIHDVLVPRS